MTTQSKLLYEHLLELGAPALPKNHHYKFTIEGKRLRYPSIDKKTLHDEAYALNCYIRKTFFFGLFFWTLQGRYLNRRHKSDAWSGDNQSAIIKGLLTEEEIDGTWRLGHMVHLAQDTHKHWQMDIRRKEEEKAQKELEKTDGPDKHIKHYLNKRLP